VIHPDEVLYQVQKPFPVLPGCEHFAGNQKFILRAFALQSELGPVFDVTCDCEDGAPAGQEREHAAMVAALLCGPENRFRRAGVRIHDPGHPSFESDLDILLGKAGSALAYLTVPKLHSGRQAAEALAQVKRRAEGARLQRVPPVHCIVETQGALKDIFAIAALPGVEGLVIGLLDFVSDHHGAIPQSAMYSPLQFEHRLVARAKAEVAAAALANGLMPTHNPCMNFRDPQAAGEDARTARQQFGFLRMYSIHPAQIMPIVEAMRPSAEEVALGAEILLAAQAASWGPVSHAGQMHDRASYRYFWDLIKRAHAAGMAVPPAARQAFFPGQAQHRAA
jgi:citrate lyase subunit beta/citryl-CoA lyase